MEGLRRFYNHFIRIVTYDTIKQNHIISYNPTKFFVWGFLWPFFRGTIFSKLFFLNTFIVMCLVTGFYFLFCDPTDLIGTQDNWRYCLNNVPQSLFLFLSGLVAFFLGFFINQTFSRWWQMCCFIGTIMGRAVDIVNLCRIYMHDDDIDSMEFRILIRRYCMLMLALVKKAYCHDNNLQDFINSDLLTPEEAEILIPLDLGKRYSIILLWINIHVRNAANAGKFMEQTMVLRIITQNITEMRGAAGAIGAYIYQQISFNYIHILTVITKLHILLISIYSAGLIAEGRYTYSYATIVFGILLAIINQFIYDGLLMVHAELLNPIGDDPNDFAIEQLIEMMGSSLLIIAERNNCPSSLLVNQGNHNPKNLVHGYDDV